MQGNTTTFNHTCGNSTGFQYPLVSSTDLRIYASTLSLTLISLSISLNCCFLTSPQDNYALPLIKEPCQSHEPKLQPSVNAPSSSTRQRSGTNSPSTSVIAKPPPLSKSHLKPICLGLPMTCDALSLSCLVLGLLFYAFQCVCQYVPLCLSFYSHF